MKILYDHQVFEIQEYGGVTRYFFEIIQRNRGRFDVSIPIQRSRNTLVGKIRTVDAAKIKRSGFCDDFFWGLQFRGKQRIYDARNRVFPSLDASRVNREWSLRHIREGDFDLLHPTYYDPYFLEALGNCPYIVTVHDFIHEVFPEFFDPRDPTPRHKKELISRAAGVIAVSENTKHDIVTFCGTDPARIQVIYHGSSFDSDVPADEADPGFPLPEEYLLYVGARHNYKNFRFLAEVFAAIRQKYNHLYLICAGQGFDAKERLFFNNLGIEGCILSMRVNDRSLHHLYSHAIALVLPSLYEGFGIPILEAFSCGCPVAASSASSFPEVAGNAAAYFDPKNFDAMSATLDTILSDKDLRVSLREKGRERVKAFSWEKAAEDTYRVYRDVLERSRS